MDREELRWLLDVAKEASLLAGKAILDIYNSEDFRVERKDDDSPLTIADKSAHNIILSHLRKTNIPVLSEEGRSIPFSERKNWSHLWIVDPLDGTKEFVKRNGEFTVNIALFFKGKSVLGVVYAPVLDKHYFGGIGLECSVKEKQKTQSLVGSVGFDSQKVGQKVVASRSHLNKETQDFLNGLQEPEITSMGSSLNFMLLAEGKADIYPRFAPTMEWDTAASHAILLGLGMKINDMDDNPLKYNKEDLLNPYFCAQ